MADTKRRAINCLVIGKAKTGTTALSHLIQLETDAAVLQMEPKGIKEILASLPEERNHLTKVLFEHFRNRFRHLNAIIHNELYVHYHKVVFIRRDLRDEMVSRLLYLAKVVSFAEHGEAAWRTWYDAWRQKEADPQSLSFRDLCGIFERAFGPNAWRDITKVHTGTELQFRNFLKSTVKRDHVVIDYEDMVDRKFEKLSEYFGWEFSSQLEDVELGDYAYTRRSESYGAWKDVFLEADIAEIRQILADNRIGDFEDWNLNPAPELNPAHYSQYIAGVSGQPLSVFGLRRLRNGGSRWWPAGRDSSVGRR